jgi:hypothetical protein
VLAVLDAAGAIVADRFRAEARAGAAGPARASALTIERLGQAAAHVEANVTIDLALETLALDLREGRRAPRLVRR